MSSFFRGQQWDNHAATDTHLLPFHARANRDPGPDATVMETYLGLPGSEYIYSEYDLGIIADILTTAEHSAANLARKGKGRWGMSALCSACNRLRAQAFAYESMRAASPHGRILLHCCPAIIVGLPLPPP